MEPASSAETAATAGKAHEHPNSDVEKDGDAGSWDLSMSELRAEQAVETTGLPSVPRVNGSISVDSDEAVANRPEEPEEDERPPPETSQAGRGDGNHASQSAAENAVRLDAEALAVVARGMDTSTEGDRGFGIASVVVDANPGSLSAAENAGLADDEALAAALVAHGMDLRRL